MLKIITIKGVKYAIYFCYYLSSINGFKSDTSSININNQMFKPDSVLRVSLIDSLKTFRGFKKNSVDSIGQNNAYSKNKGWKDFRFKYVIVKRLKLN